MAGDPDERLDAGGDRLVELDDVSKLFGTSRGVVDTLLGRPAQPVRAVENVTLGIESGDVLGIAGESGCGKTTLGKLLVRLFPPTEGEIRFDGDPIAEYSRAEMREFRKRVQMIFQDPFESLNPRMTVLDAVAEPLRINNMGDGYYDRRERVIEVLEDVELAPAEPYLDSFPQELSGGERQRVAIARALVVDPDFVVADEPVSMLDVSIRASVLNLMQELGDEYDLTYVFISHDLSLIRYMCDRTAIMYLGNVVELGPTEQVVEDPQHPYTEALFDAVPRIEPGVERDRANVTGEVPNPRNPPSGCKFHPRCPHVIPPEDWTGSQDAYRRFIQFQGRLSAGELGPEDIPDHLEEADDDRRVSELVSQGLVLDVPMEHRREGADATGGVDVSTLDLPRDLESSLRTAAERLLEGDRSAAVAELEDRYPSICAESWPEYRPAEGRDVACHLYDTTEEQDEPLVNPR